MRQNQNLKRIAEQLAEQLAKAGLISYDVIEGIAKKHGIPALSLFLETNDAYIRSQRPDIWEELSSSEELSSDDNNLEENI